MKRIGQSRRPRRAGFSLLEVAIAIVVLGTAAVALMTATQAGNEVHLAGREISQGSLLAQDVREWTLALAFVDPQTPGNPPGLDDPNETPDDLDDLDDATFCPPRNGQGAAVTALTSWKQKVNLTWLDPNDLNTPVADGTSDIVYVRVEVSNHDRAIVTSGWLVTRP